MRKCRAIWESNVRLHARKPLAVGQFVAFLQSVSLERPGHRRISSDRRRARQVLWLCKRRCFRLEKLRQDTGIGPFPCGKAGRGQLQPCIGGGREGVNRGALFRRGVRKIGGNLCRVSAQGLHLRDCVFRSREAIGSALGDLLAFVFAKVVEPLQPRFGLLVQTLLAEQTLVVILCQGELSISVCGCGIEASSFPEGTPSIGPRAWEKRRIKRAGCNRLGQVGGSGGIFCKFSCRSKLFVGKVFRRIRNRLGKCPKTRSSGAGCLGSSLGVGLQGIVGFA